MLLVKSFSYIIQLGTWHVVYITYSLLMFLLGSEDLVLDSQMMERYWVDKNGKCRNTILVHCTGQSACSTSH